MPKYNVQKYLVNRIPIYRGSNLLLKDFKTNK